MIKRGVGAGKSPEVSKEFVGVSKDSKAKSSMKSTDYLLTYYTY